MQFNKTCFYLVKKFWHTYLNTNPSDGMGQRIIVKINKFFAQKSKPKRKVIMKTNISIKMKSNLNQRKHHKSKSILQSTLHQVANARPSIKTVSFHATPLPRSFVVVAQP